MYQETSYGTSTGGALVNQEQDSYNGFQQLITQYQAVSGAVNTSSTQAVGYNYNADADGQNNSNLRAIVDPNGWRQSEILCRADTSRRRDLRGQSVLRWWVMGFAEALAIPVSPSQHFYPPRPRNGRDPKCVF